MSTLEQDLRISIRRISKDRGFTIIALIALALGIGANTAIFSVVNSVLIRPLPYKDPDRLVMLWERNQDLNRDWMLFSTSDYMDYLHQNQAFEQLAAVERTDFNLTETGEPERIQGARVSASLFPMLGVTVMRGRYFTGEEEQPGRDSVVIVTHNLWQRQFGSDPNLVGKALRLNGQSYDVIGILPPNFHLSPFPPNFPIPALETEIYTPLALENQELTRIGNRLFMVGRLKPDISLQQAQAMAGSIAHGIEEQSPQTNAGTGVFLITVPEQAIGDMKRALLLLLGAVGFVLLIACANVTNLLLARAAVRNKEMALRTALGASRGRLLRQLLTESIVLAVVGGMLGLLLAYVGVRVITAINSGNIPRAQEIGIDWKVLAFTLTVSLMTGIIFGLVPGIKSSRPDLNEALKEGGKGSVAASGRRPIVNALVICQMALALTLLIGAGLMIKSLHKLQGIPTGFNPANLLTMQVTLPPTRYPQPPSQMEFFRQSIEQIETLPGVESVATVNFLPLGGADGGVFITIEGRPVPEPKDVPSVSFRAISRNYFRTMGIPLVAGHDFTDEDIAKSRILINDTLAQRYFPNEDPIGKRLKMTRPEQQGAFLRIIGVVSDIKQFGLQEDERATLYLPYLAQPNMTLVVRTSRNPTSLVSAIRSRIQLVDSEQPIYDIRTMEDRVSDETARPNFRTTLLSIFAAIALLLSAVGIYGVLAYLITQRTHEIGIRMALGAREGDIIAMVMKHGMFYTAIGLVLGLAAAFVLMRLLSTFLYNVSTTDPVIFLVSPFLLAVVALVAIFLPARKATKVDPMVALRYQ